MVIKLLSCFWKTHLHPCLLIFYPLFGSHWNRPRLSKGFVSNLFLWSQSAEAIGFYLKFDVIPLDLLFGLCKTTILFFIHSFMTDFSFTKSTNSLSGGYSRILPTGSPQDQLIENPHQRNIGVQKSYCGKPSVFILQFSKSTIQNKTDKSGAFFVSPLSQLTCFLITVTRNLKTTPE